MGDRQCVFGGSLMDRVIIIIIIIRGQDSLTLLDLIIAYTGTSFRLDPLQFNNVDVDHIYISAGQYRCSINRQSEDWAICL